MGAVGAQKISSNQSTIEKGCLYADESVKSLADLILDVQEINDLLKADLVGEMAVNFNQAAENIELQLDRAKNYLQNTNDEVRWGAKKTKEIEQRAISQIEGGQNE